MIREYEVVKAELTFWKKREPPLLFIAHPSHSHTTAPGSSCLGRHGAFDCPALWSMESSSHVDRLVTKPNQIPRGRSFSSASLDVVVAGWRLVARNWHVSSVHSEAFQEKLTRDHRSPPRQSPPHQTCPPARQPWCRPRCRQQQRQERQTRRRRGWRCGP